MNNLRAWVAVFSLAAALHAEEPPTAEVLGASPSGGLKVMGYRNEPEDGVTVWVESQGQRADLPPSPVGLTADGGEGDSWQQLIPPGFGVSPDERWLFATQKICTGFCIGYLYERGEGLEFKIATKVRFDALAWRFFGQTEGIDVEELISSDSPAHLIDYVAFSDRYLGVSVRGSIENVPAEKKIARNSENQRGETGVYDWQCLYDLEKSEFVLPETMKAHNTGAWRRWADSTADSWSIDIERELDTTLRALVAKLGPEAGAKLRQEQHAWLEQRDKQLQDPAFDRLDFTRRRVVELQMREISGK